MDVARQEQLNYFNITDDDAELCVCKQCVPGSLFLLTQEPGIKAIDVHVYYSACRHLQENLYHLVVEMQMLSVSSIKLL